MGRRHRVSNGDNGVRVQPRTAAALHLHRIARGKHRSGPPHALRHPGLAAVRIGARRLRPQQGSGDPDRAADDVDWQVDVDRWMFFGTVPTVWLQERLKLPYPPWWETSSAPSTCRSSSFRTWSRRCCGCVIATNGRHSSDCSSGCRSWRWSSTQSFPPHRRGPPRGAPPPMSPAVRRVRRACSGRRAGCPDGGLLGAMQISPGRREQLGGTHRRPGMGQAESADRQCANRSGSVKRQPGRGDPVVACGTDRGGRGVLLDAVRASGGRCWWPTSSSWRSRWCTRRSTTSSTFCSDGCSPRWCLLVIRCFESWRRQRAEAFTL